MKYLALALLLAFASCGYSADEWLKQSGPVRRIVRMEKPSIYIISVSRQIDFYNNDNFVLQYAIDGRIEQAIFSANEDYDRFLAYLSTLGNVQ